MGNSYSVTEEGNNMDRPEITYDTMESAWMDEEFGNGPRILYSKDKILTILCERDGMSIEEAEEFYGYNIVGLYAGEQNAVFLISE